ncbi:monocarboxylate transporter 9 [Agrilus planipennis]|uniref:Monocarboxylate transporter 9 n=1 Tax=Agrilus planipennis TaxID=224129 RepID=A0A7F5R5J2_AGRPL|nr:monocarboxylate transporter 9 [Agrilus planipennis]XP_025831352.1 monocarboxylate transporter 9 [Agrilus planipennis]
MLLETKKMVPPDGGYGWIAVIGVSIVNLCTRSIEQSFGILFGDVLAEIGVATTGSAVIMSTLDALINFSGLFVGPLIRAFSYRKVSFAGAFLTALGLMMTSPARSMTHIIATYSIINGIGVGLASSATFVSLNHYFLKKRGQAVGYSMAGTAFGMFVIPHAVGFLLEMYTFSGAILILGAIALHGLVGSALLQPAKWHLVPDKVIEEEPIKEMETIKEAEEDLESDATSPTLITVTTNPDLSPKVFDERPLTRKATFPRNFSTMSFLNRRRKTSTESIYSSISTMDFTGSSFHLHLQDPVREEPKCNENGLTVPLAHGIRRNMSYPAVQTHDRENKLLKEIREREPLHFEPKKKDTVWKKIIDFLDLDLLTDPIYLNLVFGLSAFYVAEQNFKMLLPFFFNNLQYTKQDQANFLSIQAAADSSVRLIFSPIFDKFNIRKRTLFFISIFLLGISRSVLAEQTEWTMIVIVLVICGFFRGCALINFTITIAEYSSLEKLPAAFGLHMVGKGIFVVAFGPLLGYIRDKSGSYPLCLHSQTFFIMLCCFAWSIEYIVVWAKNRNKDNKKPNKS